MASPPGDDVDMHHRAFFSFEPALFLADLGNIALDYCISGIHQLERAIHESAMLQQAADSNMAPHCPQVQQQINEQLLQYKAATSEVLAEVQRRMADSLNRTADNFERLEAATNLHVPPELYVQQPLPSPPEAIDPEQEAELDRELQGLREQVQQARLHCRKLKQQLLHMDKDITQAVARSAAFKPLAESVSASSQPLLEEAAAIGALAAKLQPMVQRAQELQLACTEECPMTAALTAAAGSASQSAGGGGAAADGADAVERRVRQMMSETGVRLDGLQAMNAALSNGSS